MSVLLQFSMFPTGNGESLSKPVSEIIQFIESSGVPYQLNAMGTTIETETMAKALAIVEQSYDLMQKHANRIYCQITIDAREEGNGRLIKKVESVQKLIGPVSH